MTDREQALALFQKKRKLEIQKNGYVQCPYCRRFIPVKDAVAVHYESRQYRATEVEPMNVWAGCSRCNSIDQQQSGAGEYHDLYRDWLIHNPAVGEWGVLWLENRHRIIVKHGRMFYKQKIEEYKADIKRLEQEV